MARFGSVSRIIIGREVRWKVSVRYCVLAVGEQATVTDRGVRRVDPGHTRTVCSGYHRGPFFHVSSESSHNTSKVTKAKGKQIRGRALTGLSNTRAARRWSLHTTLLKVTTKKRREISRGRRPTPPQRASTYVDVPLRHLPGRARLSVPAYPRFRSFATERGEKFTALNHTRETKLIGGGVKRTKEESNECQGKPSFLLSTTAVQPSSIRVHRLIRVPYAFTLYHSHRANRLLADLDRPFTSDISVRYVLFFLLFLFSFFIRDMHEIFFCESFHKTGKEITILILIVRSEYTER